MSEPADIALALRLQSSRKLSHLHSDHCSNHNDEPMGCLSDGKCFIRWYVDKTLGATHQYFLNHGIVVGTEIIQFTAEVLGYGESKFRPILVGVEGIACHQG